MIPCPEIDWDHFQSIMGNLDEEALEIYEDFCSSVAVTLNEMEHCRSTGDIPAFAGTAHRLKGSFSTFGLLSLAAQMCQLEKSAREEALTLNPNWTDSLLEEFTRIDSCLRKELGMKPD